eukprot:3518575-Amphidinium_carterae.1
MDPDKSKAHAQTLVYNSHSSSDEFASLERGSGKLKQSARLFGALGCCSTRYLRKSDRWIFRTTWQSLTPLPGVPQKGDPQNFFTKKAASTRREAPGVPRRGKTEPLPLEGRELHSHSPQGPSLKERSFGSFALDGRAVKLSA